MTMAADGGGAPSEAVSRPVKARTGRRLSLGRCGHDPGERGGGQAGRAPKHDLSRIGLETRDLQAIPDTEILAHFLVQCHGEAASHLAEHLLGVFGSLPDVVTAPPSRLRQAGGLDDHTILSLRLMWELAARLAWRDAVQRPVLSAPSNLLTYCQIRLARERVDQVRVLFLDAEGRLTADDLHQTGTAGEVAIYPREMFRLALELNAAQIAVARGQVAATRVRLSGADRAQARALEAAGKALGIDLFDYLVIGPTETVSYRASQDTGRRRFAD